MKNVRRFSRRPYFFAGSFKRDLQGNPIDNRTSKMIAHRYAQHLRNKGNNARVVNWVGGSGVYIGQRAYDKTKNEARRDWLATYSKLSEAKKDRNDFLRMIGQNATSSVVPFEAGGELSDAKGIQKRRTQYYDKNGRPIRVLNNSGRLNELKFKIAQIQAGALSQDALTDDEQFIFEGIALMKGATSAKHTYQDSIPIERRIDQVITKDDFDKFNIELIGEDDEYYMAPKSQQEVLDSMIADKFNDLDGLSGEEIIRRQSVMDNAAIREDMDLYLHLNAIESSWPLIENILDVGDKDFYESSDNPGIRKQTVPGLTGWGTEITKGPGSGRFADVSEELVRYHVAASYQTDDGYEETPLMAFATEEQAEEFLQRLDELGRTRGEFLFGRERVANKDGLPPTEDFDLILPYENVELNVIRETASEEEKEALENEMAFETAALLNVNNPDRETGIQVSSSLGEDMALLDPRSFEAQQDRFLRENRMGKYSGFVEDEFGDLRVADGGVLYPSSSERIEQIGPKRPFDNLTKEIGVEGAERLLTGVSVVDILDIFNVQENLPNDRQRQMNIEWANNLQRVAEEIGPGYTWGYRDKGIMLRYTENGFVLVDDDLAEMIRNNESLSESGLYKNWLDTVEGISPKTVDSLEVFNEQMGDYGVDYRFAFDEETKRRINQDVVEQLAQRLEQMAEEQGIDIAEVAAMGGFGPQFNKAMEDLMVESAERQAGKEFDVVLTSEMKEEMRKSIMENDPAMQTMSADRQQQLQNTLSDIDRVLEELDEELGDD